MKKLKIAFDDIHEEKSEPKYAPVRNSGIPLFPKKAEVTSIETLPKNFTFSDVFDLSDIDWRPSDRFVFYGNASDFSIKNETKDEEIEVSTSGYIENRYKDLLTNEFDLGNYSASFLEDYVYMTNAEIHSFASDMANSVYDDSPSREEIKDYLSLSDREFEEDGFEKNKEKYLEAKYEDEYNLIVQELENDPVSYLSDLGYSFEWCLESGWLSVDMDSVVDAQAANTSIEDMLEMLGYTYLGEIGDFVAYKAG